MSEIKVGDAIPSFKVTDHEGYPVTNEDLIGGPFVLYFYPKDATPGCTQEACSFNDHIAKFDRMQTLIIGVSPDNRIAHKKFIKSNKLQFTLLCDEKKELCQLFGVVNEQGKVIRSTFVCDEKGIVKWVEKPVKIEGHVDRVQQALKEHCNIKKIDYTDVRKDYEEFLKGSFEITEDEKKVRKQIMKEYGIKPKDLKK